MGWLHGNANLGKAVELIRTGEIKKQDIPAFYVSACANPKGRGFMLDNLEPAVRTLQEVFVGSGAASRIMEQVIPLLGLGWERQTLERVQELRSPDIEKGIEKGTELLQVYSRFVNDCME